MVVPSKCYGIAALQILTASTWHFYPELLYFKWCWDVCWEGTDRPRPNIGKDPPCHISAPIDSTGARSGLWHWNLWLFWLWSRHWPEKFRSHWKTQDEPLRTFPGFPPDFGHVWAPSTSGSSWQRPDANVSGLHCFSPRISDAALMNLKSPLAPMSRYIYIYSLYTHIY